MCKLWTFYPQTYHKNASHFYSVCGKMSRVYTSINSSKGMFNPIVNKTTHTCTFKMNAFVVLSSTFTI
jgi:hypothetical protein